MKTLTTICSRGWALVTVLLVFLASSIPLPVYAQNGTDSSTSATPSTPTTQELITTDCSLEAYYAEFNGGAVSEWDRVALGALITRTHTVSLVKLGTQAGQEDVFAALRDLDAGTTLTADGTPTVHLLMRHLDFDAALRTPEGWTRADLWPVTRAADPDETRAGVDVHAKRPEDWEVEQELRGLFWGTCGQHLHNDEDDGESQCVIPAVPSQTAADTATDYKTVTPPAEFRGDVARSLLYMVLRYSEELGLHVKDCPPFATNEIGYLSDLLQWHQDDPPSVAEQTRNQRVCERWQGNRNPFVDYPDLVPTYFGKPDTIVESTKQYTACMEPTLPPTATPNACLDLGAGDVQIIIWNGNPINQMVVFPVVRVAEEVGSIFITDQAWDATQFVANAGEGTLEYSIPEGGLSAGGVFGYNVDFPNDSGEWEMEGTFDIGANNTADNLLVYCLDADMKPHFLSAITTAGAFTKASASASFTVSDTTLPQDLVQSGNLALPQQRNYLYIGSREGRDRSELLAAFQDPANYEGRSTPYNIVTSGGVTAWKQMTTIATLLLTTTASLVLLSFY